MKTDRDIFEQVAELARAAAPQPWTALRLVGSIHEGWGEVICYATDPPMDEREFFAGGEAHDRMYFLLLDLKRMMLAAKQPPWNTVELRLSHDGAFKADFSYDESAEE